MTLVPSPGISLPSFEPGAHIELTLGAVTRRYSLTSRPDSPVSYEICVLRTRPSRGGSAFIHDSLKVDDTLEVSAPINAFPLDARAEHSVFIAGGIGITPFIPMIIALRSEGRSFDLHYSARSLDRLVPVPEAANRLHTYIGESGPPRLSVPSLLETYDPSDSVYVCGPRSLIEAVRCHAEILGWSRENVRFESFGSSIEATDAPVTVKLARSRLTVDVQPGTSILDALLENGVWATYECHRGECASCAVTFLSGEADHRDVCLTASQRRTTFCTCVSWARSSEITLDL